MWLDCDVLNNDMCAYVYNLMHILMLYLAYIYYIHIDVSVIRTTTPTMVDVRHMIHFGIDENLRY